MELVRRENVEIVLGRDASPPPPVTLPKLVEKEEICPVTYVVEAYPKVPRPWIVDVRPSGRTPPPPAISVADKTGPSISPKLNAPPEIAITRNEYV